MDKDRPNLILEPEKDDEQKGELIDPQDLQNFAHTFPLEETTTPTDLNTEDLIDLQMTDLDGDTNLIQETPQEDDEPKLEVSDIQEYNYALDTLEHEDLDGAKRWKYDENFDHKRINGKMYLKIKWIGFDKPT